MQTTHTSNRRTTGAISEAYGKLKERTKEVELYFIVKKTKAMVQNKKTRRRRRNKILTIIMTLRLLGVSNTSDP